MIAILLLLYFALCCGIIYFIGAITPILFTIGVGLFFIILIIFIVVLL